MNQFTDIPDFWNIYITAIVLLSVIGCGVFLWSQSIHKPAAGKVDTTGHVWDETLEEYNHPLPKWWMWLFYITVVFALVYLALYPGLGRNKGMLGWSSASQHAQEVQAANDKYGPIYEKFRQMPLNEVAANPDAMEMGKRLYLTYCMQCHGADAKGSKGFPNLTDNDWQWGGEPETIETTIKEGRVAVMPSHAHLGAESIKNVVNYVRSLSGLSHDSVLADKGKEVFQTAGCIACHGPEAKGTAAMGAPNLTDKVWLYGNTEGVITETVTNGRQNRMPAWGEFLGDAKVHILAAYVLKISGGGAAAAAQ